MEREQLVATVSDAMPRKAGEALAAACMLRVSLQRVEPQAHWSYGVIDRNMPVGTDDHPCYSTRFLIRIDDHYAANRIKLIGKTKASRTGRGFMPRVYRPDGRYLQTPNASFAGRDTLTIEFDDPPADLVFEVKTPEEQFVRFDCKVR
jgi:hypothetical protein